MQKPRLETNKFLLIHPRNRKSLWMKNFIRSCGFHTFAATTKVRQKPVSHVIVVYLLLAERSQKDKIREDENT